MDFLKSENKIYLLVILFFVTFSLFAENPRIIKVSLSDNSPLVFTDENGEPAGFFTDIIKFIASQESWELRFIPGTWRECLDRLENGNIDLLMSVAWSQERAGKFDFTVQPVINNWGQLLCNKGTNIESIVDSV